MQRILAFLALLIVSTGFLPLEEEEPIVRPLDPFVFRSTLDERPRMISLALHPQLWAAYDATTCQLYKAWNGRVKFEGAVFNSVPLKQPVSEGYPYIEYPDEGVRWRVDYKGESVTPKTHFKGYNIYNNKLTFRFELELPDGHRIKMTEYPEYSSKKDGAMTGLQRIITTENVPKGAAVRLLVDYDAMLFGSDLKTSGKLVKKSKTKRHYDWGSLYHFIGEVVMNSNEETELTTYFAMSPESISTNN